MYGAILGDIVGSPYEFDWNNIKTKEFPLFSERSCFTDDTVMAIAVADALMTLINNNFYLHRRLDKKLHQWGKLYPDESYGVKFGWWLSSNQHEPYNSFGNGAAMRVASVGWLYETLEETRQKARLSAEITHNHSEGLKGAEATASAIWLARTGSDKATIKNYIEQNFHYDLSRTCDEIRPTYRHVETCQETVPEAITAFLESENFEDALRLAVSLGGDSDTLTCITGGIAEAFYGIPEDLKQECLNRVDDRMKTVLSKFDRYKLF